MILNKYFHNTFRLTVFIAALVLALCVIPVQGPAQEEESASKTPGQASQDIDPARLEKRLKEVRELVNVAGSSENEQTAAQLGTTLAELQERNAMLRSLEAVYRRLLTSFSKSDSLKKEEKKLEDTLKSEIQSLVPEQPPYSLSNYDSFLDRLTTARQREESSRGMVQFKKEVINNARDSLNLAEKELRKVREQLESEGIEEETLISNWKYKFASLKEEQAEVFLNVQLVTRDHALTEMRIAQLSTQIEQKNVAWIKSRLAYDQEDLNKHLDALKERSTQLNERIAALVMEQRGVETKWLEAQGEVERAQTGDALASSRSTALLEAREAWRETYQKVLERSEAMNQVLDLEEQIWQRRYALLTPDTAYEEMDVWKSEMDSFSRNAEQGILLLQRDQANIQSQIATLKAQLSKEELDPVIKQHMETRLAALQKSAERTLEFMSMVLGMMELQHRLTDEIDEKKRTVSLKEKVEGLGYKIQKLWGFELWVIDDRGVTVRKVVIGLVIFIIGLVLARVFTGFIRRRLSTSDSFDKTAVSAIEKMLYYFILLILFLFALRIVNIPLTAFTVFGGAIAIGVGFGAQNLINNFISGFILMIERPVKIGDLIEVDNNYGVIEEIGSRCTRIRTGANIHILVPNSSFLEKNIINWTLADQKIRTHISVGVAYGSDTRKVKKLMLRAAGEHGKVLKDPEPYVLFSDFGDNALTFEIYFWISLQRLMDRRVIESDLRFIIDEIFREAGIVIAFPQRDIHLDITKPLDLRIVKDEDSGPGPG